MLNHQDLLHDWLKNGCHMHIHHIQALKGDASLRRYYRVLGQFPNQEPKQLILMDAKNAAENTEQFIFVGKLLESLAVRVPQIYQMNLKDGFLLLEDFGDTPLLDILNMNNVDVFYKAAFDTLANLQINASQLDNQNNLPPFDYSHMYSEVQLFIDWFLRRHLGINPDEPTLQMIQKTFDQLLKSIEKFPQTIIHRDFHSRNLMVMPNHSLGVIDFQDAMYGPRAYDVVSLLKDCYIVWDEELQKKYCQYFLKKIHQADEFESFWHEFQICGLQRHLKVLGIFARIVYRDHKLGFMGDLPRVWNYTIQALEKMPTYKPFYLYLKNMVEPLFLQSISSC